MIVARNNKIFSNNTGLVSHSIERRGEKPYKCSHCDKTFSIKSHLNNILIYRVFNKSRYPKNVLLYEIFTHHNSKT